MAINNAEGLPLDTRLIGKKMICRVIISLKKILINVFKYIVIHYNFFNLVNTPVFYWLKKMTNSKPVFFGKYFLTI